MIRIYAGFATFLAVQCGMIGASWGNEPAAVSIILDCSRSMDLPLAKNLRSPPKSPSPVISRFDASKNLLNVALTMSAQQGDHQVGLWLTGHRLAWTDAKHPVICEQNEYLAQSNGPALLPGMIPGDDVESIRAVCPLTTEQLLPLLARLQSAKPWGESPMYPALCGAIHEVGMQAQGERKGIIVFTDGGNEQYFPLRPKTLDDVISQHYRHHIPVHIVGIALSSQDHAASIAEWREIARRTRGSYCNVHDCVQLESAFFAAVRAVETGAILSDVTSTWVSDDGQSGGKPTTARLVSAEVALPVAKSRIDGVVLFFGQPVKNAKVETSGPTLKTVKTDEKGSFSITDVVPGKYELKVEGIAQNKIREGTYTVVVPASPQAAPYLEADLN